MPLKDDTIICYLCGTKARTGDLRKSAVKFKSYRGDFACEFCIDEIRSDTGPTLASDAPSPDDLKEIEPYLEI